MSRLLLGGPSQPPKISGVDPPSRLEISKFVKIEKFFSLYIQALQKLHDKESTDRESWFQIGAIHGVNSSWNGSPGQDNGYCVHGLSTFSTWHRGYVTLIEQAIQTAALDIAEEYTVNKTEWTDAAKQLRQPYWGWDDYNTFIPPTQVIEDAEVEITIKDGTKKFVPNPFLAYTFPADKQGEFGQKTSRDPDLRNKLDQTRQSDFLAKVEAVYLATSWSDFSTRLENNPHNTIHNQVGETMATWWSSFDPIFWLHHCQVDRVLYKWYNIRNLWTAETTDLNPFLRTQTNYWDSPGVKQTNDFNYEYPSAVITIPANIPLINLPVSLRFSKASEAISSFAAAPTDATPAEFLGGLSQQFGISIPTAKIPQGADAGEKALTVPIELGFPDWRVRISVKKFEVGGSFSIYIFQGDVPADSDQWYYDPSLVGTFDVFVSKNPATCGNCAEQRDKTLIGYVHLSRSILKNTEEGSLNKQVVLPHLEKLHYSVKKVATKEVVDPKKIPSLNVTIERAYLNNPTGANHIVEGKRVLYNRRGDGHFYKI